MVSFDVKVLDGEGLPLPSVEVGARYRYEAGPRTWSAEVTDGDGHAAFCDDHPSPPLEVVLFVGDEDCGCYPVAEGAHITLEM
jgi:hypothetical protein